MAILFQMALWHDFHGLWLPPGPEIAACISTGLPSANPYSLKSGGMVVSSRANSSRRAWGRSPIVQSTRVLILLGTSFSPPSQEFGDWNTVFFVIEFDVFVDSIVFKPIAVRVLPALLAAVRILVHIIIVVAG